MNAMVETQAPSPAELLRLAIEQKADPTYLRELMHLQREWEANQARNAYVNDMAKFMSEEIEIEKDKEVSYASTKYKHATLGNVVEVIGPRLAKNGFSHRWLTDQNEAGLISVTCIITHRLGHHESTTLRALPDASGGKNSIQAIGSTVSYLERYTLLAATGVATSEQDDDAASDTAAVVDEAALLKIADWTAAVTECADLASLSKRHFEIVNAYGGSRNNVPTELKQVYAGKKKMLSPVAQVKP